MEFHEYANLFPMMDGESFAALVSDIQENGLLEPIAVYDEKILDGRNRYKACVETGAEPRYERVNDKTDPLKYVISKNLNRRHLNESQRGVVADKLADMQEGRPKTASIEAVSQVKAANLLNVSRATLQRVKAVRKVSPELIEKIESGEMTAHEATKIIKQEQRIEERKEKLATAPTAPIWIGKFETGSIYQADVTKANFANQLPENSVDLIVTDPPWDEGSLTTYEAAARIASRVLKPGHFMAIYSGKMFLPKIMNILFSELEYVWAFSVFQPDSNDKIQKYHLYSAWRPVLLVKKPGETIDMVWMPDSIKSTRDKKYHEWGQGVELVEKLVSGYSQPGEIVLDPFVGGASVPYVAKTQKRRYIGFDISEETVRLGLARLSE